MSGCWGLCFNPRCARWRRWKTLGREKKLHRPSNHHFLAQLDAGAEAGGEGVQLSGGEQHYVGICDDGEEASGTGAGGVGIEAAGSGE